jgi:DNA-binding MarR family transcriptional regulator
MNNLIEKQLEAVTSSLSRTNEIYGRWAKKQGLNYNSLMILYTMHRKENCTQKQICDEWLIPKQTVNTICKEFNKSGHLIFETNPNDKRGKLIKFTKSGRTYADGILNALYTLEEKTMQKMGAEMCECLVKSNKQFCEFFEHEVKNE